MKILLSAAIILCGLSATINPAFAQTWTPTSAPNVRWGGVASSADGSKLIAADSSLSGGIYMSTNSGANWMSNAVPTVGWDSVASSANGSLLAAGSASAGVYVSTNGGTTWTQAANVTGLLPGCVATSANGYIMFVAAVGGTNFFFISTNAGATWTSNSIPALQEIASSADATKLVAVGGFSRSIYTSTNSGTTWASNNVPGEMWSSLASSTDGKTLAAAYQNTPAGIFTSTNFGSTWTPANVPNFAWTSIASSADGTKLVAAGYNRFSGGADDPIYISTNSGVSWTSNSSPNQFYTYVASSADGSKLAAAVASKGIYVSFTVPTPQLNITPANSNLTFSWLVPSTNFVLQENSDLTTTDWLTLTNTPTLNLINLEDEVTLSASNHSGFFRLISQ